MEQSGKQSENKSPMMNDVLQSDHHVQMSDEEIAKARAHHNKRHGGDHQKNASAQSAKGKKNVPAKPR
jgi:hypothetical protein